MPGLKDVRDGLETVLSGVTGLSVYGSIPENLVLPAAAVIPISLDFDEAMAGGLNKLTLDIYVMCSVSGVDGERQDQLDGLIDPAGTTTASVLAALRANTSLSLTNTSAHATGWSGYGGSYTAGNTPNIGAIVHCEIAFKES